MSDEISYNLDKLNGSLMTLNTLKSKVLDLDDNLNFQREQLVLVDVIKIINKHKTILTELKIEELERRDRQ